jgi:DNA-binding XRE family transcriptional regulator
MAEGANLPENSSFSDRYIYHLKRDGYGNLPVTLKDVSTTAPNLALVRRLAADGRARKIRQNVGLSLYDLARDLGVTPGTVSRWETGMRVPRGEAALRYADLLSELLDFLGGRHAPD